MDVTASLPAAAPKSPGRCKSLDQGRTKAIARCCSKIIRPPRHLPRATSKAKPLYGRAFAASFQRNALFTHLPGNNPTSSARSHSLHRGPPPRKSSPERRRPSMSTSMQQPLLPPTSNHATPQTSHCQMMHFFVVPASSLLLLLLLLFPTEEPTRLLPLLLPLHSAMTNWRK